MEPRKMMGFVTPGDQRIPVTVRDWNAMKLALWRSKAAWQIVTRTAVEIMDGCRHVEGCAGAEVETEPCLPGCSDRELRMSALVILSAARMFSPIDARRPSNEPYMAPSREYFSEIIAELGVAQIELDALREALRATGVQAPSPPPNTELPAQRSPWQLSEHDRAIIENLDDSEQEDAPAHEETIT